MVKVFVAQTHENHRIAVCDFLKAAGFQPEKYGTTPQDLVWLGRELYLTNEPTVLVTSQRDITGCDYISRLLHTCLILKKQPSLTVVFSGAVAYSQQIRDMTEHLLTMLQISTELHQVKIVGKTLEVPEPKEHAIILRHMQRFLSGLNPENP